MRRDPVLGLLAAGGVGQGFAVPGESVLPVLDALHGSGIAAAVRRQAGGAASTAETHGRATGRPRIVVTR